jgi:hypothetical protein
MKTLVVAIHGILTNQTDPSWPDHFDAWMFERDPEVKVLKKEYFAGPFPRWNCWVKDPRIARGLANELELFLAGAGGACQLQPGGVLPACKVEHPPLWFVAHSNGAVIALLTTRLLIQRGYRVGGLILTGAAVDADLERNGLVEWGLGACAGCASLGAAIAYASAEDEVVAGDARAANTAWARARDWAWGKLMWPYGCLGRTGWLWRGQPVTPSTGLEDGGKVSAVLAARGAGARSGKPLDAGSAGLPLNAPALVIFTRWYAGGHSTYFAPKNIEHVFERIYGDINEGNAGCASCVLPGVPEPKVVGNRGGSVVEPGSLQNV